MNKTDSSPEADSKAISGPGITTFTATTISVADMVGIGVFTSLGFQVLSIQSPFSLMMLWIVGGVVALCGALCYGELAAALVKRDLIDRLAWFRSPKLIGDDGRGAVAAFGIDGVAQAPAFVRDSISDAGQDVLETYRRVT